MASYETLPNGKVRAQVKYLGHRRRTAAYATKAEARRAAIDLEKELADELGAARRRTRVHTVADLIERHVALSSWSPTYIDEMERAEGRIPADFAARRVDAVTPGEIDELYDQLRADGVAVGGVRRVHDLLGAAFRRAVKWGWCKTNPVRSTDPPVAPEADIVPPSTAVVALVLAAIDDDPQFAAYVRLAATAGLRRGEMVGLRWGDIDLDAKVLRVERAVTWTKRSGLVVKDTKTGKAGRGTLALDVGTVAAVRRWRTAAGSSNLVAVAPAHYVFGLLDRPRRPDWATQRWVRLRDRLVDDPSKPVEEQRKIAEGVRLNDLRHYMVTKMIAAGVDIRTVQGRARHTTPVTTLRRYAAFEPERDRAAADDLGAGLG